MTCANCATAATRRWHGYTARCRGCEVRALAVGLQYFEAEEADRITPGYRAGLQAVFGDAWEAGHAAVKAEKQRIDNLEKQC